MLSIDTVKAKLQAYRGWELEGSAVVKTYRLESFTKIIEALSALSVVAEHTGISPKVLIDHNSVRFTIGSENGGVDSKDLDLLREIEQIMILHL